MPVRRNYDPKFKKMVNEILTEKDRPIGRSDTNRKLFGFFADVLKKELFGGTILYWLNILFVQWFFTRIYRNEDWTKFGLLKPVLPLTGWWNNYIFIFPKRAKNSK